MTTEITIETVKERIAALEGAGELSLKERVYLWAMSRLVAITTADVATDLPITRERLLEIIVTGPDASGAEQNLLARSALAAMDSKPVAVVRYVDAGFMRPGIHVSLYDTSLPDGTELFTSPRPAPVVHESCVTAEHRRVIEMLLNVCGAAFELADDSCQQDVDGEDCHVVPDDAFQKLSDALDEIENTLPTEDVDRPNVFLAWSAMPRAALKSLLHAQAAPVVPEVLQNLRTIVADPRRLPRRKEWIGGQQYSYVLLEEVEALVEDACRAAMLRAEPQNAPQNIPEIIPDTCTCPSGDGSLRWPCPAHPGNSPVSPDTCTWTFSSYDSHWSGTCGIEWIFTDGGPEENGVKFCPKCGRSVAMAATEGTEE